MNANPLHLSKIDLSAFRGIQRTLGLEFGRRLTIIYGGNATGKSSIAQAIEFAITGQVRDSEDGVIPSGYLTNTRAEGPGRVSLRLDDGTLLIGPVSGSRRDIEQHFREIGNVDWPAKQPLPLTTTHVTTQGMLARVLGSTNAVTRNDLSGLCAGAYLRFLVARAEKLADHFRQASAGRNMQTELRDARAAYATATLLHDSLVATSRLREAVPGATDKRLRELNARLGLPAATAIEPALVHLETDLSGTEERLRAFQQLLTRTRELGQYEAELAQLTQQREIANAIELRLKQERVASIAALAEVRERLSGATSRRASVIDFMATHERRQQALAEIAAMDERLHDTRQSARRLAADVQHLRQESETSQSEMVAYSTRLAQLRQARQSAEVQRKTIEQALADLQRVPVDRARELDGRVGALRKQVAGLEPEILKTSQDLAEALLKEQSIATKLGEMSSPGERRLVASAEMREFVTDGHCPLCGHDHGAKDALESSIERVLARAVEGLATLRAEFDDARKGRRDLEAKQLEAAERIAVAEAELSRIAVSGEEDAEARRALVLSIEQRLRRAGLTLPLGTEALKRGQAEIEARISGVDQEIRDISSSERDEEIRRSQLERAVAAKVAETEQLGRLSAELAERIAEMRAIAGAITSTEEITQRKEDLVELEPVVRELERQQGQLQTSLLETERAIAEKTAELAGIARRLEVVDAFLNSLDAELGAVGASRDLRKLLNLEQAARQRRDGLAALKSEATAIKQDQRALSESRALAEAHEQLSFAEHVLKTLQSRQQRLQVRSGQFKKLYEELQSLQNATAEIVLANIREPVSIVFQAMTAGCPWDIEFRLEDNYVNAVLTDGSTRDIEATSVLNSAYINVAAIALRLALASQQRWTRLRTVVFDDPILEMDNLTQSALIDGLEAVLSSQFPPWKDLQFVLTTWSEDFAVMAAHKLAHLNTNNLGDAGTHPEDFIIHRLSSDLEGTIVSQRHVPRWRSEATAA